MQRRTYGILAAGVITTTAVTVIVNQSAQLREAGQHRHRLEQAAERLCRTLEASPLLFLQASAGTGEPGQDTSRSGQQGALMALGLSLAPPADAPGRQPGIEPARSPGAGAAAATVRAAGGVGPRGERPAEPDIICLSDNRPPQMRVLADPVQRNLLWLAPVPQPGQAPSPWLQLNLERTLGPDAGFSFIPLNPGAPPPLNLEWSRNPLTRALLWLLAGLLISLSGLLAYSS